MNKMDWKHIADGYEMHSEYEDAIVFLKNSIDEGVGEAEIYVRLIYLTHHFLLEEDYPKYKEKFYEDLLRVIFNVSRIRFKDNAEYLFFIGYILNIAEWLFGIEDEEDKTTYERMAFRMSRKAYELEPDNCLYEWGWRLTQKDEKVPILAMQSLSEKWEWLRTKGFPGNYIIESLAFSCRHLF